MLRFAPIWTGKNTSYQSLLIDCWLCLKDNPEKMFIIRGKPVLFECTDIENFPRDSDGRYYGAHYICSEQDCNDSYLPVSYRTEDIVCNDGK
jgi:hypothetical protein